MIPLFPVRDTPLRFIFTEGSWSIITQKSGRRIFLEGQGYKFKSCLYSQLAKANSFALIDGTPFRWATCCHTFCHKFLSARSCQKKRKFLQNRFHKPHCPLRVSTLTPDSYAINPLVGSVCLLFSFIGEVVNDRAAYFGSRKNFATEFRMETVENPGFIGAQVVLYRSLQGSCGLVGLPVLSYRGKATRISSYDVLLEGFGLFWRTSLEKIDISCFFCNLVPVMTCKCLSQFGQLVKWFAGDKWKTLCI